MNAIRRTLATYVSDAKTAFRVAPVEVALGVTVAVGHALSLREANGFDEDAFVRLVCFATLSFLPLLGLTALHLRGAVTLPARIAASVAVLGAAGWYATTVFAQQDAEGWRWACLFLAGLFFLLLTPAVPPHTAGRRAHWQFAFGILARGAGVLAYAAVLYASLAGAIAAVANLFELETPRHLYGDLAGAVFFAGAPWILVGGMPRLLEDAALPRQGAPVMVQRFGRFLYAPIIVVYLAIVYAYMIKVGVTGEVPKNLLSPLVIGAGLVGMAGALLLEPVHADRELRGLSLLVRWFPALLLPLLPFAAWAVLQRHGQYGWTEFRYLRLAGITLLAVVAVLGTVWLARRRMPPLASVPGILALGLLLVSIGPWSAQAVSRRDQQRRLRAELHAAGVPLPVTTFLPVGAAPRGGVSVSPERFEAIQDGVRYLANAHGMSAVVDVLGPRAGGYTSGGELAAALPIRAECSPVDEWELDAELAATTPIPVRTGHLIRLDARRRPPRDTTAVPLAELSGERILVRHGGWHASADLAPVIARLRRDAGVACGSEPARGWGMPLALDQARLPLRDAAGGERGELIVTGMHASRRTEEGVVVAGLDRAEGFVLLY